MSFPRSVGTTPVFYNYIKGSRPLDPGQVLDNGALIFGHQVRVAFEWPMTMIERLTIVHSMSSIALCRSGALVMV